MRKIPNSELDRLSVEEYRKAEKLPVVVVADNVRSLHNVGSLFRTADAFSVGALWLCGITAVPPDREIHKTALGAEESVEWRYFTHTADAVAELKAAGYTAIAVEQVEGAVSLDEFRVATGEKYALVFGNEVKGVGQEVVDMCDSSIEIPQAGTKHSLNVSVSAGAVLWEFFRQYRHKGILFF